MIVCCPSVPHCGHHFLMYRMFTDKAQSREYGWRILAPKLPPHIELNTVYAAHFDPMWMPHWHRLVSRYPVIVPLRHPARVAASYAGRTTVRSMRGDWVSQWDRMLSLSTDNWLFLHLDDPAIRVRQAQDILNLIGSNRIIDWSIGDDSGSKAGTHDLELTPELLEGVPQRFIDFYEGAKPVPLPSRQPDP